MKCVMNWELFNEWCTISDVRYRSQVPTEVQFNYTYNINGLVVREIHQKLTVTRSRHPENVTLFASELACFMPKRNRRENKSESLEKMATRKSSRNRSSCLLIFIFRYFYNSDYCIFYTWQRRDKSYSRYWGVWKSSKLLIRPYLSRCSMNL